MYKYSFKRILLCLLAIIFMIGGSSGAVYARGDVQRSFSFYCMRNKQHLRPSCDAEITQALGQCEGVYYIDPTCTDAQTQEDKVLYLTFDVGYENGNVARILDTLQQKQVGATFFILEHVLEQETQLVMRMFNEGHVVGNHTLHHKDMSRITDRESFCGELEGLEALCLEKTGHSCAKLYRPPEGRFSTQNLLWAKEMGYSTIFWSFAYADWDNDKQPDPRQATEKIMEHIHNGEILLLHPTSATNAAILSEIIDRCRDEGYRFDTIEHMLLREQANPTGGAA